MKSNWKDVPIPARMENLEKDERGFPVPFVIFRDQDGKPHFKINDSLVRLRCVKERRCAICGQLLGSNMWTLGGVKSAFHPHGVYNDTPIHYECGRYALQVCPNLAYTQYAGGNHAKELAELNRWGPVAFVDPTSDANRPAFFVFAKISDFKLTQPPQLYVVPERPFLLIEYWNDGEQITPEHAFTLLILSYEKLVEGQL